MEIVHLVGMIGSATSFLLFVPQATRVWRFRRSPVQLDGISVVGQVVAILNSALWIVYAVLANALWTGVPSLVNIPLAITVIIVVRRARRIEKLNGEEPVPHEPRKNPRRARRVTFMNKKSPLHQPSLAPASLGEDARTLYGSGRQRAVDRDWFDPKTRNRYLRPEEKSAYEPSERDLAAIAEIEAAGLGTYRRQFQNLYLVPVHEKYSVAQGRGSQYIEVWLLTENGHERTLLAVLEGGDLETKDGRDGQTDVRARHVDATDFEHDASSTAIITVQNASAPVFQGYGRVSVRAVMTEARLYPLGTDPLTQSDGDTEAGNVCTECKKPHPFAPYQPPLLEGFEHPRFVEIVCLPIRPYLVATGD